MEKKFIIRDPFSFPPIQVAERNSGEIITDPSGYMTTKQQVDSMRGAGLRLADWRNAHYDGDMDTDLDNFVDETRSPNFDMADITAMEHDLEDSIRARQRREKDEFRPDKVFVPGGDKDSLPPQKEELKEE